MYAYQENIALSANDM